MARGRIPTSYDHGWVYYERLGEEGHEEEKSAAIEYYERINFKDNTRKKGLGAQLIAKGNQERKKEVALIEEVFEVKGFDKIKPEDYLRKINEIMNVGVMWKPAVQQIKNNLEARKTKTDPNQKFYLQSFTNIFTKAYKDNVERNFNALLNDKKFCSSVHDPEQETKALEAIQKVYNDSYEGAFQEAVSKLESKNLDIGTDDNLRAAMEAIVKGADRLKQELLNVSESTKSILSILQKNYVRKNGGRRKTKDDVIKIFKYNSKGLPKVHGNNQLKGDASEEIASLIYQALKNKSKNFEITSSRTIRPMYSTDNTTVFTAKGTVDQGELTKLLEELTKVEEGTDPMGLGKEVAAGRIQEFYDTVQAMTNGNAFVVYDSVKNYSLGDSFHNFGFGGTSYNYDSLRSRLESLGYKNAREIINKFNNTMNGAILEGKRTNVEEALSKALASNIAEFLYDDYRVIGNSDNRAIHMFNLGGIMVPLSFFLIASGNALKLAEDENITRQWFSFHFNGAKEIKFHEDAAGTEKWNEQREEAISNFKMSISFLRNFEEIVKQYL